MGKCIICGKEIKQGIICDECKRKVIKDNLIINKGLKLKICPVCGRYFYKNRWAYLEENTLSDIILRSLKLKDKVKSVESELKENMRNHIEIKKQSNEKNNLIILFRLYNEEYLLEIPLVKDVCPSCLKKKSQAYKGVLQLRNVKDKELLKQIDRIIKLEVKSSGAFITKSEKVRDGKDYYITTMKGIRRSASKIKELFGSYVSYNRKLFSRDNLRSKNIYRVNTLVRVPDFKKGDIVSNKSNIVIIKGHTGGLSGINLLTGKKMIIKESNKEQVEENNRKLKNLPAYETIVTRVKPNLRVMHPKTFQESVVSNQQAFNEFKGLNTGDRINVVLWEDKVLILPDKELGVDKGRNQKGRAEQKK